MLKSTFRKKSSRRGSQSFFKTIDLITSSFETLSPNKTSLLKFNENSHHPASRKKPSDSTFDVTTLPPLETSFPSIKRTSSSSFGLLYLANSRLESTSRTFLSGTSSHSYFYPTSNLYSKPSFKKIIGTNKNLDLSSQKHLYHEVRHLELTQRETPLV